MHHFGKQKAEERDCMLASVRVVALAPLELPAEEGMMSCAVVVAQRWPGRNGPLRVRVSNV